MFVLFLFITLSAFVFISLTETNVIGGVIKICDF
jgi:hypothetical protein